MISFYSLSLITLQPIYALEDFNFAATGDWGCSSNADNTVNNIVEKKPEFVFGLGDYSYQSTGECWFNRIAPIDSLTKISIGNHEDDDVEGFSGYMSHFGLSQTYYSYDHQNVHILVVDSDKNTYSSGSDQYDFILKDLQTASQNPSIDWIIVYLHKQFYTSPNQVHPNTGPDSTSLRNTYHPLFDQYGVDLVLQGHVHNYQRTFPLNYNPESPQNPVKSSTNPTDYTDPAGPVFAVVGTGGVSLHALSGKASFVSRQQDDFFGQLDIKITNDGTRLEGRFYPNGGGSIQDSFSITKTTEGSGTYNYAPGLVLTGSNYQDTPSSSALQLSQFSVAAWFKTSSNFASDTFIVNKGGIGSDSAGQNMNYGIWMTSAEKIQAGFEAIGGGADHFVTSPNTYNDGQWHYAVVTYGGSTVILYIDGVQVGTKSTSGASPETSGTKPVRVGANSRVTPPTNFFTGEVDEVIVWNDDLTTQQISDAFAGTSFNTGEQVLYLSFSPNSSPVANNQSVNVTKNTYIFISLTATDPDDDSLNYSVVTPATNGTLSGTAPNLTYNPNTNFVGMDSFTFKANDGTIDSNIAIVNITVQEPGQTGNYNYAPGLVLTGSNYQDTPSSSALQLSQFSVAAWFKTSSNFASDTFIVNKGGIGSDSSGQNMNYGIWMTSTEKIKAGFETSSGADQYVTSPNSYNDNQWHYTVVTNNGANVILYIDGVQVATKATSGASPESIGTKPVRVGANSRVTPPTNFFTGEIDEIRIWNSALSASQISSAFGGTFAPGHVLHLSFGGGGGGGYNYAPSFAASGSSHNDTPDSASLRLNQFTVAAWFKTSTNFGSDAYIVNKGGVGSDSSGQNLNYGIWMNSAEQVKAGFETSSGADQFVTSPTAYTDGQWHYAVVTNNGANVILYIDGVQVATKATSGASPESIGTKPVRVAANSRVTPPTNFFTGEIDEVRLWNSALSASQVSAAFGGTFASGQVLHLPFDSQSLTGTYTYDPSLSLSGPGS